MMEKKAQATTISKEGTMKTYFMCSGCGYLLTLEPEVVPHTCPACGQACAFINVTAYRPEASGTGPDTKVMALLLDEARAQERTRATQIRRTRGLMGSDANALCREAALMALRELLKEHKRKGVDFSVPARVRVSSTTSGRV